MSPVTAPCVKLSNGQSFPTFGLGTWAAPPGEVGKAVKDAIDVGYRHIDGAMFYGNEKEIGTAIREVIQEGVVKREELFITSKLWNTFHRAELVEPACRQTVADLGLEYVDLYLFHWPVAFKAGENLLPMSGEGRFDTEYIDITETYKAMEKCVELGLAKSIGLSNFNSEHIKRILRVATIKPVTNQIECHPYLNQKKLIKFCSERNIIVTAYGPLGAPGASYAPPGTKNVLKDVTLNKLARKYGKSVAQICLRYLIQLGTVPIPKSVKKERLLENISIFDFEISVVDMALIDALDCNGRANPFSDGRHDKNYPFGIEY